MKLPPPLEEGTWFHGWHLFYKPHPLDREKKWRVGCVCMSFIRSMSLRQMERQKHCGCGRKRYGVLSDGQAWGTFTVGGLVKVASGLEERVVTCSCGASCSLLPARVTDSTRPHCVACAEPMEADKGVTSGYDEPDPDQGFAIVEHKLLPPPFVCPSAYMEVGEVMPRDPDEKQWLPRLRDSRQKHAHLGKILDFGCPCGTQYEVPTHRLRAGFMISCLKCARLFANFAPLLPASDFERLAPALPPIAHRVDRTVPLLPRLRLQVGAHTALWTLEQYDEIPHGDEELMPRRVEPGLRLGTIRVGIEIPWRIEEHDVRCDCGSVGYARKEDLQTGRLLSCPTCQWIPPVGVVSDVSLRSWNRLVRDANGFVTVWVGHSDVGPDRLYRELVERWAAERLDVRVLRLDYLQNENLSQRLRVRAFPTLLFYYDGINQEHLPGLYNIERVRRMAQAAGYDDLPPRITKKRPVPLEGRAP